MKERSIRQQFADTMLDVGTEDEDLVVLVGDISHFALQPFAKAAPDRYYNVGICEQTIVSMGAGISAAGLHPVMHTIAPFLIERAFEQIKLDFCYQGFGGTLVTVGSAFDYGTLGCTHHCYDDFALVGGLPGTEVVYPATAREFDVLFRQVYRNDLLSLVRVPASSHGVEFAPDDLVVGKGIKVRDGSNLSIVVTGPQLASAQASVPALTEAGWDPEIIYIHTVKPLDTAMVAASVAKTGRVLVVEEHGPVGGLSDAVLRAVQGSGGPAFASLCIPDAFIREYASYEEHCERLGLSAEGIVAKVAASFSGNAGSIGVSGSALSS